MVQQCGETGCGHHEDGQADGFDEIFRYVIDQPTHGRWFDAWVRSMVSEGGVRTAVSHSHARACDLRRAVAAAENARADGRMVKLRAQNPFHAEAPRE